MTDPRQTETRTLARINLGVGVGVLAVKMAAFWISGSVAIFSDALESTVNVVTALVALGALRVAARPADGRHPFGHHKAEFISAVFDGVMIIVAALVILSEAVAALRDPALPTSALGGMAFLLAASAVNGLWARHLIRRGRALRAPALVADGRHLMTDVFTSVGVVTGLGLALATGWWMLDPLIAIAVALVILWSGFTLVRESLNGLMDEAISAEEQTRIAAVIAREGGGAMQAHDLRTRHAGSVVFVDFHLVVPDRTTIYEAHEICDRIEDGIRAEMGRVEITIHVEPEHKSKSTGIMILD